MSVAGLDLDLLQTLRPPPPVDLPGLRERIAAHLEAHDGYLPFSGGKDSTVVLHLARQVDPTVPVVWFHSGLEFPETVAYIDRLAADWDLNLHVLHPARSALQVLADSGCWDHRATTRTDDLHAAIITAPAAAAHRMYGDGELWGIRSGESTGRRKLHAQHLAREVRNRCHGCCDTRAQQRARHGGVVRRNDGTVAYSPIWDWPTGHIWNYLGAHRIPPNPLYAKLRRLGVPDHMHRVSLLLDGSRLDEGRAVWLKRGWPGIYNRLAEALPRLREYA